jgi:flagellar basal body rod protein FlgG
MSSAEWIAQDTLGKLDRWVTALNRQAVGTGMVAYKANRVTWGGGETTSRQALTAGGQRQIGEQQMYLSEYVDFSQGDIQSSNSKTHLAIRGEGLFAIARDLNAGTEVSYTRNGEFHKDAAGLWRTREGYYLLGADDVDPEGNVVRDPAAYGRPYPPMSALEPFGPGALGITDLSFNGALSTTWGPAVGGAAPANYTLNLGTMPIVRGTGPNAAAWQASNVTTGKDGFADVGWYNNDTTAAAGDPNGDGRSLHYGAQNVATYASGNNSAQKLDVVIDWDPPTFDPDLYVEEPDGLITFYGSVNNNGTYLRDSFDGNTYNQGANYALWDEWYSVNLTARASGVAPVAEGIYRAYGDSDELDLSFAFVEDAGTIHERIVTQDLTNTRDFLANQTIATAFMANRRNAGELYSRDYALDATFGTVDIAFAHSYDLDTTVSAGGDERDASVDTMTWGYRFNGAGAFTTFTVPKATFAQSWADISASLATGGATSIQFMWAFDTIDGKENQGRGWNLDNLRITQTGATNPWVQVRVTDIGNSVPPGYRLAIWDGTSEGPQVPIVEGSFVNVPYAGTWPIVASEIRIYDTLGNLMDSNAYAFLASNAQVDVSAAMRRGVQPAVFLDPNNRLEDSTYGYSYYEPKLLTDVPTWDTWKSSTNPTGASLVKGALEGTNSPLHNIAPELVVAQRTYDMISKVLSMRKSSFDQLAGLIR